MLRPPTGHTLSRCSLIATRRRSPNKVAAIPFRAENMPIHELVDDAVIWASQHGLVVGLGKEGVSEAAIVHAPLAVRPTPFPRESFEKAKRAATVFNLLVDRVASDDAYLQSTLAYAAKYDEFTAKLLDIHKKTQSLRETRNKDRVVLGINRSDYMLDDPSTTMLQVEINTIASSFGCLSTLMGRLHRYVLERASASSEDLKKLPANAATQEIAGAMAEACKAQGEQNAAVLMVVEPGEKNSFDQQWLQTELWERHKIRTLRRSLTEIADSADYDASGKLSIAGTPIALVYYRAGYSPDQYAGEKEWTARLRLEESSAVQCPSVAYQLAGAKKVQQDLSSPETLERYLDSNSDVKLARSCFAGLWSLDDTSDRATQEIISEAISHPEDFVLKPQREGGGNNLYGDALQTRLQDKEGLSAFILMQRIRPPVHSTQMVREGKLLEAESISELGIYGTFVRRGKDILLNREAGHLVRTKAANSDEGGVAAGFAVLDSPILTG